jgi:hypothetical protein
VRDELPLPVQASWNGHFAGKLTLFSGVRSIDVSAVGDSAGVAFTEELGAQRNQHGVIALLWPTTHSGPLVDRAKLEGWSIEHGVPTSQPDGDR